MAGESKRRISHSCPEKVFQQALEIEGVYTCTEKAERYSDKMKSLTVQYNTLVIKTKLRSKSMDNIWVNIFLSLIVTSVALGQKHDVFL